MKFVIILSTLVGIIFAAPQIQQQQQNEIVLLQSTGENDGTGNYNFAYEQSDGTKREEKGELRPASGEDSDDSMYVTGSYQFVAPNGELHWVKFVADKNGYHPTFGVGNIPN